MSRTPQHCITVPRLDEVAHFVVLHGSIASGKTTLLERFKRWARANGACALDPQAWASDRFLFVDEPLNDWDEKLYAPVQQDDDAAMATSSDQVAQQTAPESLLDKYYARPRRYAYLFQTNAFTTRLQHLSRGLQQLPPPRDGVRYHVVCEGGMSRDDLFAEMLFAAQTMEAAERDAYRRFFQCVAGETLRRESVWLYVPTSPATCKTRQQVRGRECERDIPLDYLEQLERAHEAKVARFAGPVLRLDDMSQALDAPQLDALADRVMRRVVALVAVAI